MRGLAHEIAGRTYSGAIWGKTANGLNKASQGLARTAEAARAVTQVGLLRAAAGGGAYSTLGVHRYATRAAIDAAYQAKSRALSESSGGRFSRSGLKDPVRAARQKALDAARDAIRTERATRASNKLFDEADKALKQAEKAEKKETKAAETARDKANAAAAAQAAAKQAAAQAAQAAARAEYAARHAAREAARAAENPTVFNEAAAASAAKASEAAAAEAAAKKYQGRPAGPGRCRRAAGGRRGGREGRRGGGCGEQGLGPGRGRDRVLLHGRRAQRPAEHGGDVEPARP